MTPQVLPSEVMTNPAPGKKGLVRYTDEKTAAEKSEEKEEHTENQVTQDTGLEKPS
jgi:hypothetical protein